MREISLLGTPKVTSTDGAVPRFRSQRTVALLGYLAAERRTISRDRLAAFFWPDAQPQKAKGNLRRELHNLSQILPDSWDMDRVKVRFTPAADVSIDLDLILQHQQAEQWQAAADLLRGEFLEGITVDDNREFETWLLGEIERWRQRTEMILSRVIDLHIQCADNVAALDSARKLLQLTPWNEVAHRQVILLLARTGQRSAALRQYTLCQEILREELGVEPSAETISLYEQIKRSQTFAMHNVPAATMPLIGRERELSKLEAWLDDPEVRLITITGAGGMGKTRLALALAQAEARAWDDPQGSKVRFKDGVYLVPMASLSDASLVVTAVARALNFPLQGPDRRSSQKQLFDFLHNKQLLFILDNLEHLLGGVEVVTELLQAAPLVQVVATSRARLRLQGEQILDLKGLDYASETGSAARLFLATAQRVQPDFQLSLENSAQLDHICRLVEGMPLALELAASWANLLSLENIAREIERSIDFLQSSAPDLPARHRSMRAVIGTSWQRLSDDDRIIYVRLSVFVGGFTREAAEKVCLASLALLSRLVNHSLLYFDRARDRYQVHELLRQYAAQKLGDNEEENRATRDRFVTYYMDFLEQRSEPLHGPKQREIVLEIEAELDNARLAWEWALAQHRERDLKRVRGAYAVFHFFQSRFHESLTVGLQALVIFNKLPPTEERDLVRAALLNYLAYPYIRLGQIAEAEAALEESNAIYRRLDKLPPPGFGTDPPLGLAIVALIHGAPAHASELAQKARVTAESRDDKVNLGIARYVRASAYAAVGQYDDAYAEALRACVVLRQAGHEWMLGYTLLEVGKAAQATGRYDEAKRYYETSIPIRRRLDVKNEAEALILLGQIALLQADREGARLYFQDARLIYEDTNDRGGLAEAHRGLGQVARDQNEFRRAGRHLEQALRIAAGIQFWPLVISILVDAGCLMLETEELTLGLETLALSQHHDAAEHDTRARAAQELAAWQPRVDDGLFYASVSQGKGGDLESALVSAQQALSSPFTFQQLDSTRRGLA